MRQAAVAALLALAAVACRGDAGPADARNRTKDPAHKAELALLTALPLAFAEGFTLDAPPHPAMELLERSYSVRLVDGPEKLPPRALLLAAQPRALPAERLVALDRWVRGGGRLVLLADPLLAWPSKRPLGDPLRPPIAFADTGLLGHWGLTLFAPDAQGPQLRILAGKEVLTASSGVLEAGKGACTVDPGGLSARCALGKGQAIVVADADFLNVGPGEGALDGPTADNLAALAALLDSAR